MKILFLFFLICADAIACSYDNRIFNELFDHPLESKSLTVVSTRWTKGQYSDIVGVIHKKWGEGIVQFTSVMDTCHLQVYPLGSYLVLSHFSKTQIKKVELSRPASVAVKLDKLSEYNEKLLLKLTEPEELMAGQVNQFWSFCDKDNDCIKTSNKCAVNSKFKDRYEKYISTKGHSKECPVNDLNDNPVVKCEDNFCK